MNDREEKQHEAFALNVRRVLLAVAGCVAMLAMVLVVSWWGLRWLNTAIPFDSAGHGEGRSASATVSVQPHQAVFMRRLRDRQQARLQRYERVQGEPEAASIPIERALELLAEHDWQVAWPEAATTASELQDVTPANTTAGQDDAADNAAAEKTMAPGAAGSNETAGEVQP